MCDTGSYFMRHVDHGVTYTKFVTTRFRLRLGKILKVCISTLNWNMPRVMKVSCSCWLMHWKDMEELLMNLCYPLVSVYCDNNCTKQWRHFDRAWLNIKPLPLSDLVSDSLHVAFSPYRPIPCFSLCNVEKLGMVWGHASLHVHAMHGLLHARKKVYAVSIHMYLCTCMYMIYVCTVTICAW